MRYLAAGGLVVAAAVSCLLAGEVLHLPSAAVFAAAVAVASLLGMRQSFLAVVLATLLSGFLVTPHGFNWGPTVWTAALTYIAASAATLLVARAASRKGFDQKLKLASFVTSPRTAGTADPEGETPGKLLGRLDGDIEGEVYGWALNTANPLAAPKITFYVANRPIGEVSAVHYRPDVGSHCFYFDLNRCRELPQTVEVEARYSDGHLLSNSPRAVSIPGLPSGHKETVLFMHISKTAGTAFREAMLENYKQSEVACIYPDPPGLLYDNLALLPLEQRANFRMVVGHFQYGYHRFFPQKSKYVTIVRDPVSRVVSEFRYLVQREGNKQLEANGSPERLAELLERKDLVTIDNHLVRCFSGVSEIDFPAGRIDREIYEMAVRHLKADFVYVGHQERSNEAYQALRKRFEWKPRDLEMVNRGPVAKSSYDSVRKTIEHFNEWDCKLYAEILRQFPV